MREAGCRYCYDETSLPKQDWIMIRLLIVLAIVALATLYFNAREGEARKPEEQYIEATDKARALELQVQEQAAQQLRDIDAHTE